MESHGISEGQSTNPLWLIGVAHDSQKLTKLWLSQTLAASTWHVL